ncbi:ribonuclease domain-containing protein [Arcicella sp. DC2W]|uniref:Ribonuclease domain-containing protein n=1 Tax=Arcicella gelida TaxID=2984195 RepID=A0ABU5S4V2_9BACT|nr:ribonuclease domain-containing protein [Arcicella sp. DC2W]MEA5403457.1 ribonuclease domain-containing protein [Arcicella sp. DC2W]
MKNLLLRTITLVISFLFACFSANCYSTENVILNNHNYIAETCEKTYYYEVLQQSASVKNNNSQEIPQQAIKVLKFVRENGHSLNGYVGGRKFGNYEGILPKKDKNNQNIYYREWDIYPKIEGKNRGAERLVTGSDKKAYYTKNHYQSFVEIK